MLINENNKSELRGIVLQVRAETQQDPPSLRPRPIPRATYNCAAKQMVLKKPLITLQITNGILEFLGPFQASIPYKIM